MEHTHATPDAAPAAAPDQVAAGPAPAAPFPVPALAGVAGPVVRRAWAYRPDKELTDTSQDRYHWFGPKHARPEEEVPSTAKLFNLKEGEHVPATQEESDRFDAGELKRPGLENTESYLETRSVKKGGKKGGKKDGKKDGKRK